MIHYLVSEIRINVPLVLWPLSVLLAILRLTGVIHQPTARGWLMFLESMFPLLFPLLSFSLLEREKNWHTLEVTIATSRPKGLIFLVRYLVMLVALLAMAVAMVRPGDYLLLLAPGVLLGATALAIGLILGEEVGLGVGLSWWGFSLLAPMWGSEIYEHPIARLFILQLLQAPLSPQEFFIRKWAHLAAGCLLLFFALAVAEWKRSWKFR
ncbi:MAG: hypothetical protein ACUVRH_05095 [Candidatus Bipolaricaulia bacterium]